MESASDDGAIQSPMFRYLRLAWTYLRATLVIVALITVLSFATARLLLPVADNYRHTLAVTLTQILGQVIQVNGLTGGWRGFHPLLRLDGLQILDPLGQRPAVELAAAELELDLLTSFRLGHLVPSRLILVGPRLTLVQQSDGRWGPEGLVLQESNLWRLGNSRLMVEGGEIQLRIGDQRLRLMVRGELHSDGTRHQLTGEVRFPDSWGGEIKVAMDAWGERGPVTGYLEGKGLALRPWINRWYPELALGGSLDGRLWLDWAGERLQRVTGRLDRLTLETGDIALGLEQTEISGDLLWQPQGQGWRMNGASFQLARNGQHWPPSRYQVEWRPSPAGESSRLLAQAAFLDLADMAKLAGAFPQSGASLFHQVLRRGTVHNLAINLPFSTGETGQWLPDLGEMVVDAELRELAWQALGHIPGMRGINVTLQGTGQQGTLEVNTTAGHFDSHLFRQPWTLEQLQGRLTWQKTEQNWHLATQDLRLATPDIAVTVNAELDIPPTPLSPVINLEARLLRADGRHVPPYLPARVMPPRSVRWLDRSIRAAQVNGGTFTLRGRLRDFPYDQGNGKFDIDVHLTGGELDYAPDWPMLHDIQARLHFYGRSMDIEANSGHLLESTLQPTQVSIPDLDHEPHLLVRGRLQGPAADLPRIIRDSPLNRRFGHYAEGLEGRGEMGLTLNLDMPLADVAATQVGGQVTLQGADLLWRDPVPALEKVKGELSFSGTGVVGNNIEARIYGLPVRLTLRPRQEGGPAATVIEAKGRLDPQILQGRWPSPLWRRLVGEAPWQGTVTLPTVAPGTRLLPTLRLTTNLQGMALELPGPLNKKEASQPRPLVLETVLGGNDPWRLSFGSVLAGSFLPKERRGELRLGDKVALEQGSFPPEWPVGLKIRADFSEIDGGAWSDLLGEVRELLPKGTVAVGPLPWNLQAQVGTLQLGQQHFTQVQLAGHSTDQGGLITLKGPDIQGEGNWQTDKELLVKLERLRVTGPSSHSSAKDSSVKEATKTPADPRRLPPFQLACQDFQWDGVSLGQLDISSQPSEMGLTVSDLRLEGPLLQVKGNGEWQVTPAGHRSALELTLTSDDLGDTLSALGYAGAIQGATTQGELRVYWPGPPSAFALDQLTGKLNFTLGKGQLIQVDPGAGRVFGLLSLQTLPRRLALDFSDIFHKGLAFDRITGNLRLEKGSAYSDNLRLEGPAVVADIVGRTGLTARDYDQVITITPQLGEGLPLAGALAAGSVGVGAAILLAQRLLQPGIEQMARLHYTLKGSWDEPLMETVVLGKE